MLIFSLCLCGISINYFNKEEKPWSIGAQLYLIFFNCIPRPLYGFIFTVLEIGAHIYLQDLTRSFDVQDELPYKIFVLDVLGLFFPAILEFSGLVATPQYYTDFFKYNIFYGINILYTFFVEGETFRYIMIGAQVLLLIFYIIMHIRTSFNVKLVHKKVKKIYSMAGSGIEDSSNYLIVEQEQVIVATLRPRKNIQRSFNIPSLYDFVGYSVAGKCFILYDKKHFQFKSYDTTSFQSICTIQSEENVAHIVHAHKNYLAVFSQLAVGQDGTLITVYDCTTGQQIVSVGLSHKINKQENLLVFDSFAIDLEKTSDKLLFSYEKLLCSLDIDSKVNESLSSDFSGGFTLHKANERRVVFSGKEDWAEMFDVPTNQPASMNNVFLSYSRLTPIQGLNEYYFVEPCCSKKNIYIMKGYGYDMQMVTFFQLGYPNIGCAQYNKETSDITFVDLKKGNAYRMPFQVSGKDTMGPIDFQDSIVALD